MTQLTGSFPGESNETRLEALGQRISEIVSQNFVLVLRATGMVGNDSFPHQRMFDEVSKPLSAEISEISNIRPKYKLGCSQHILTTIENSNFVTFANY